MSEDQEKYRPRSPDLSEFLPRHHHPTIPRLPSFHPSDSSFPLGYSFSPRGSYDASPFFPTQTSQTAQSSYFGSQTQTPQTHASPNSSRTQSVPTIPQSQFPPPRQTQSQDPPRYPAPPPPPPTFNTPTYASPATYQPSHTFPQQPHTVSDPMARTRGKRPATYFEGDDPEPDQDPSPPPPLSTTTHHPPPTPPTMPSGPLELTIDVKTKFPVARIKRIMQADEDVGKVAQATPTAVAKALELFMITLVTKAGLEARVNGGNAKRITAQHLKTALMADPQFDFLGEQCANVPDESGGAGGGGGKKGGRGKSEAKSEDSDEEMGGVHGRKKSKGSSRKMDSDE